MSETFDLRLIASCLPVDLDLKTGEPVMGELAWARHKVAQDVKRGVLKREWIKANAAQQASVVPIEDNDLQIG